MSKIKKKASIGKECVACGTYVYKCPVQVLSLYKGLFTLVDESKCIGCGLCVKTCPAGVIEIITKELSVI